MKHLFSLLTVFAVLSCSPAFAGNVEQAVASCSTTNVTISTTTEKTVIASDPIAQSRIGECYRVFGWAQVTTGTNTTGITAKLYRGSDETGTAIGEGNVQTLGAAAGSNEVFTAVAVDCPSGQLSTVTYAMALTQAGASGNGTSLNQCVLILGIQ